MTWWQWLLIFALPYLLTGIQLGKATEWSYQKIYALRRNNDPYTHWYEAVIAIILCPFTASDLLHGILNMSPQRRYVYDDFDCTEKQYYAIKAATGLPWHCAKLVFALLVIGLYVTYQLFLKLILLPLWKPTEAIRTLMSGLKSIHSAIKKYALVVEPAVSTEASDVDVAQELSTEERITQVEQRIAQSPDGQLLAQLRTQLMHEQEGAVPYRGAPANTRVANTPVRIDANDVPEQEHHRGVAVSTTYL